MLDGDWFENQFEATSCNFRLLSRSIVPACGKSDCRLSHVFIAVTRFALGPHLRFLFPLSVFLVIGLKLLGGLRFPFLDNAPAIQGAERKPAVRLNQTADDFDS